jgi:hypothetical protein
MRMTRVIAVTATTGALALTGPASALAWGGDDWGRFGGHRCESHHWDWGGSWDRHCFKHHRFHHRFHHHHWGWDDEGD